MNYIALNSDRQDKFFPSVISTKFTPGSQEIYQEARFHILRSVRILKMSGYWDMFYALELNTMIFHVNCGACLIFRMIFIMT